MKGFVRAFTETGQLTMLTGIVNVGAAMPTIHASEFKARCLATMDSVVSKGEVRVVTKNGLPMPAWHPYASERSGPPFGLRPKLEICADIIEPLADIAWEALARSFSIRTPCLG